MSRNRRWEEGRQKLHWVACEFPAPFSSPSPFLFIFILFPSLPFLVISFALFSFLRWALSSRPAPGAEGGETTVKALSGDAPPRYPSYDLLAPSHVSPSPSLCLGTVPARSLSFAVCARPLRAQCHASARRLTGVPFHPPFLSCLSRVPLNVSSHRPALSSLSLRPLVFTFTPSSFPHTLASPSSTELTYSTNVPHALRHAPRRLSSLPFHPSSPSAPRAQPRSPSDPHLQSQNPTRWGRRARGRLAYDCAVVSFSPHGAISGPVVRIVSSDRQQGQDINRKPPE
ncbi:hypothetical protein MSAN_00956400 [Mycena sanguinolenta]|uniref:Transmembrane protein n=1 Tax=Mycena sanguinolenta TaxID=230812 RepID=A0A8H6YXE3_9AGAR|nr:hypothetical protein MSAN_00956400 [Mycena sanguinolenta]